jgi:hypothetical protein
MPIGHPADTSENPRHVCWLALVAVPPGEQSSRLVDEQSRVLHPDKVRAAAAVTHEVHRIAL